MNKLVDKLRSTSSLLYVLNQKQIFKDSEASNLQYFFIIIYIKKLFDPDWLRALQFKCNTSAKRATHRNSGLSLAERQ